MSSSDWIIIPTRKGNIKNVPNHQPVGIWFSAYLCINLGIRSIQRWFDDQTQKIHDSSDPSALTLWVNTGMGYQGYQPLLSGKSIGILIGTRLWRVSLGWSEAFCSPGHRPIFLAVHQWFPWENDLRICWVFHMNFMLLERETCLPDCQQDSWNTVKQGCDLLVSSGWRRFFLTWERTTNHCGKEKNGIVLRS
jgi:hypothetical protein